MTGTIMGGDVDDHPDLTPRLGAIALLGQVGAEGTATDLEKRMAKWAKTVERAEREPDR